MSIARDVLHLVTILACSSPPILAEDKTFARTDQKAESFTTLNKEFKGATKAWFTDRRVAYAEAMIPHEREMVARLKGKPFELVGISIDSEVKTLQEFLAKEKLPWTHWWAGPGGWESSLAESWDIRSIPSTFVLDSKGVIRFKNIRGEELAQAVNVLLAEAAVTESVSAVK